MGPALKVLNRQLRGLMKMLRQLDKLGEVGTRVLNKSADNIVASLRHLQPTLTVTLEKQCEAVEVGMGAGPPAPGDAA